MFVIIYYFLDFTFWSYAYIFP